MRTVPLFFVYIELNSRIITTQQSGQLKSLNHKKQVKSERLRADFYEEMVAFGKEVYGIDLKKAGTK